MKIVTISDTHNQHELISVPDGDVVIHAGDFSSRGTKHEIKDFIHWYGKLPHKYKILIAGNHDIGTDPQMLGICKGMDILFKNICEMNGVILLNDSEYIIDNNGEKIKIWGSPVTPTFGYGWAWNRDRDVIEEHWKKIPKDVDILVTHGPAHMVLDKTMRGEKVGCKSLSKYVAEIKPKMHIFGHIHEDRGVFNNEYTVSVNACSLSLRYRVVENPCYVFNWEDGKKVTIEKPTEVLDGTI